MSSLGTYLSSYKPWTPSFIIPEPGESLTWDWMDGISQFSQRFRNVATHIATMTYGGTTTFDYSALGCDYFPPILKAYYHSGGGTWKQFDFATTIYSPGGTTTVNPSLYHDYGQDYVQFKNIGFGTCLFVNNIGNNYTVWQLIAYM